MALVAIMRQNARFRADGGGEHPLVGGLNGVRLHHKQPAASKRADYIAPFVDLITSPEAPGPITGAALVTVDRLLREGVVELGPYLKCVRSLATQQFMAKALAIKINEIQARSLARAGGRGGGAGGPPPVYRK